MRLFILGANGFIGNWLVRRILETTDWHVVGLDLTSHNLSNHPTDILSHPRFTFHYGNVLTDKALIDSCIKTADVVIPLAAIANPAIYIKDPLRIFKLDFESNLEVVRACVQHKKRLIFPSTSEVYGMCPDHEFDEDTSSLVVGPIQKERWIYSCSKQMLDRVIYAYGQREGLSFTLFRPFNWMGPKLDTIHATQDGDSRAFTQFLSNGVYGRPIKLVGGGEQKRAFIYIDDAIDALMKIIENKHGAATNEIFNIGNPNNNISIKTLAEKILNFLKAHPHPKNHVNKSELIVEDAETYFGEGYQDTELRVPSITKSKNKLNWTPETSVDAAIQKTINYYFTYEF